MIFARKAIAIIWVGVFALLSSCEDVDGVREAVSARSTVQQTNYQKAIALQNTPSDRVITLINQERNKAGLSSLNKSNKLMAAAAQRAKEQAILFSHTRPDGSEFWTVDPSVVYGECLSKGYGSMTVVNAWMNSTTHRAVILDPSFVTIGIGIYEENGVTYIALEVGY